MGERENGGRKYEVLLGYIDVCVPGDIFQQECNFHGLSCMGRTGVFSLYGLACLAQSKMACGAMAEEKTPLGLGGHAADGGMAGDGCHGDSGSKGYRYRIAGRKALP